MSQEIGLMKQELNNMKINMHKLDEENSTERRMVRGE